MISPVLALRERVQLALIACAFLAAATGSRLHAADESKLRPWTEYRTIMWIGDSQDRQPEKLPLFYQRLREMGVNTAMVHHDQPGQALLDAGMPYYVENMVNKGLCLKWNSHVADWDKVVTAWKTPRDEAGLVREYSLDDPAWRSWARGEMQRYVRLNMAHQPVAYDIRDELSTTMSANPFDYDFSRVALAGFRVWLKTRYADLAALNAEWETQFASWDEVKPFTTDQIKNRMASGDAIPRGSPDWQAVQALKIDPEQTPKKPTAWNLAPWCDHRTYTDASLAGVLQELRLAARELDPQTPSGIEGTQMPSAFGGYDLWRLSQSLDWVEPYDIGNAREIFGSFMPGKPIITTVGEQDARAARRRLWHLLLEGDRGCLVWWSEDCIDWKTPDYKLTPRAQALTPVLAEMTSPLARLFLRAAPEVDPIGILYSQPSIQVDWLLESTVDGSTWLRRFSSFEAAHNRAAQRRQAWVKFVQDAGYTPRFISSEQVEKGGLKDVNVLILPDALALSRAEIAALSDFRYRPPPGRCALVGSGAFGRFDEHGKFLGSVPLIGDFHLVRAGEDRIFLLQNIMTGPGDSLLSKNGAAVIADYLVARTSGAAMSPGLKLAATALAREPLSVRVPPELCVRTHRSRLGAARLLAFERNPVWQMGEDLKQHGGNESLENPVAFEAKLAAPAHAYDLRSGQYLGRTDTLKVALDPWQPSLYALTPEKLPEGDVIAALQVMGGK